MALEMTWAEAAEIGARHALFGLSRMVSQDVDVTISRSLCLPVRKLPQLLDAKSDKGLGVHFTLEGDVGTHLLVLYESTVGSILVNSAGLARTGAATVDELERSALAEAANVMCGYFLNALSDASDLSLLPSPPSLVAGSRRTAIDFVAALQPPGARDVLVAHSTLSIAQSPAAVDVLTIPSETLLKSLLSPTALAA